MLPLWVNNGAFFSARGLFFLTVRHFCPPKEPQALLENPLFLVTALPSRCIGPAAIKAVHPSLDTSSRPGPLVSHVHEQVLGFQRLDVTAYSFDGQYTHIFPHLAFR